MPIRIAAVVVGVADLVVPTAIIIAHIIFVVDRAIASAVISSVELAIVGIFRVRIDGRRTLWLVQRIRALVLFPHAVHDEHHHQDGAQQADNGAADHSCTATNRTKHIPMSTQDFPDTYDPLHLPAKMPGCAKKLVVRSSFFAFMMDTSGGVFSPKVDGRLSSKSTSISFSSPPPMGRPLFAFFPV